MNVEVHPAAQEELHAARIWYEERSPLSAVGFAHEIAGAISRIAEAPSRYPLLEHGTRKVVLQRFPFSIFYRATEAKVVIIAIAHQKRRPGYWRWR